MVDLAGAWMKLDRAREHIDSLEAEIAAMFASNPLRVVSQIDEDAQQRRWVIRFVEGFALPPRLALLAGDAAHNLRSALDHLAFAAAGKMATKDTAFPVWRHPNAPGATTWKSNVRSRVKGASRQFEHGLCARDPRKGGSDAALWEVDHLDIIDKHKTLLLVITTYDAVRLDFGKARSRMFPAVSSADELPSLKFDIRPADRLVTDGTELFSVSLDADFWEDPEFIFSVCFDETLLGRHEPVVDKLRNLVQSVSDLINELTPLI